MNPISPLFGGGAPRAYSPPPGKSEAQGQNKDKASAEAKSGANNTEPSRSEGAAASSATPESKQVSQSRAVQATGAAQASTSVERTLAKPEQAVTDESFARVAAEQQQQAAKARLLIDQISGVSKASQGANSYKATLMADQNADAAVSPKAETKAA